MWTCDPVLVEISHCIEELKPFVPENPPVVPPRDEHALNFKARSRAVCAHVTKFWLKLVIALES